MSISHVYTHLHAHLHTHVYTHAYPPKAKVCRVFWHVLPCVYTHICAHMHGPKPCMLGVAIEVCRMIEDAVEREDVVEEPHALMHYHLRNLRLANISMANTRRYTWRHASLLEIVAERARALVHAVLQHVYTCVRPYVPMSMHMSACMSKHMSTHMFNTSLCIWLHMCSHTFPYTCPSTRPYRCLHTCPLICIHMPTHMSTHDCARML